MDELAALRARSNELLGAKLSVNDFIIKAAACALKEARPCPCSHRHHRPLYHRRHPPPPPSPLPPVPRHPHRAQVPAINSSWSEAAIRQYSAADISVAVNTDRGAQHPAARTASAALARSRQLTSLSLRRAAHADRLRRRLEERRADRQRREGARRAGQGEQGEPTHPDGDGAQLRCGPEMQRGRGH